MFDPSIAYAAGGISEFIYKINRVIINPLIFIMFSVALAYFLYGMVAFIRSANTPVGRDKGKQHMLWGIIGMVIMVSVFGILHLLVSVLGVKENVDVERQQINVPDIPKPRIK